MAYGKSMRDLEKQKVEKVSITDKNVEKATRVKRDIDEVYKVIDSLPEGLDEEISSQMATAERAAQREAGKDGTELEDAQNKTNQEMNKLCDMVEQKIKDNTTAANKLRNIRAKYGKKETADAVQKIETNTAQGEAIISESDKAMEQGDKALRDMRSTIDKR